MRVAVVTEALGPDARPDQDDAMVQAEAVVAALDALGHAHCSMSFAGDIHALVDELRRQRIDVVFNLVESVDGRGEVVDLVPAALECAGVPCTGSGAAAMRLAAGKLGTKARLRACSLPTPDWSTSDVTLGEPTGRWVVKSVWEHGSLGLEADCVVEAEDAAQLSREIDVRRTRLGGSAFAERYVHGREFNLGMLASGSGVEHLPVAEISFGGDDSGEPWIVGYRAKWHAGSVEDLATPRCFGLRPEDAPLVTTMRALAEATWREFGLAGYARVDLRVDERGAPWIIDVNTNPCLSPDAGFAAALAEAGIPFSSAIERILGAALYCA